VETMDNTRRQLLEHFDAEVHDRLRVSLVESTQFLDKATEQLWRVTSHVLGPFAELEPASRSFVLSTAPPFASGVAAGRYRLTRDEDPTAHRYRPQHPLAAAVLDRAAALDGSGDLTFDYTGWGVRAEQVAPLVGCSGVVTVDHLTLEGLESEDHLLIAGMTDEGRELGAEQVRRLFDVPATAHANVNAPVPAAHEAVANRRLDALLHDISTRQGTWFEEEMDKLDRWAEDKRTGLKADLREHDDRLKELKREVRQAATLPDKLALQKQVRSVEAKRDEAWRAYDAEARDIEIAKEQLIDDVEARLGVVQSVERVIAIRFSVV
jgi:hypothetical protein